MSDTGIFEIQEYYDGEGRRVTMKIPIRSSGTAILHIGEPFEYIGYGRGQIKDPTGKGVNVDYVFEIDTDNVIEAFAMYDEASKARWPEIVEQFKNDAQKQQSRIQIARSVDETIVTGGNGRGMKMRR